MKVSFTELKRHVIEVEKREEELEKSEEEYYEAERAFHRKVDQLRAEFLSGPRQKVERDHNRRNLWYKKRRNVREALEERYPGLSISYNGTLSTVRLTYLGKVEDVAWEDVEDWMVITLLQSDNGRE